MESWWENLDPVRKPVCNCCKGLDVDGEKFVRTERSAMPGIFTGAELPSKPELARPADIELLIGEFVSLWIESTKFNESSRCNSSNAFPAKENDQTLILCWAMHDAKTLRRHSSTITYLLQIQPCRLSKTNWKAVKQWLLMNDYLKFHSNCTQYRGSVSVGPFQL